MEQINIKTEKRKQMIDITPEINNLVDNSFDGIILIYCPHTTAAVTINEGADPDVMRDILKKLEKIVPYNDDYMHSEGNSDAHIKSSLIGVSEILIAEKGRLILGTWQKVFFCEFDGPRNRRLYVKKIPL